MMERKRVEDGQRELEMDRESQRWTQRELKIERGRIHGLHSLTRLASVSLCEERAIVERERARGTFIHVASIRLLDSPLSLSLERKE